MAIDLKLKIKWSKFFGCLVSYSLAFVAPFLINFIFLYISANKNGVPFRKLFEAEIFGSIMQGVMGLFLIALVPYFFYKTGVRYKGGEKARTILSWAAGACFLLMFLFAIVSTLIAVDELPPVTFQLKEIFLAMEAVGVSASIVIQCLLNTDIYAVVDFEEGKK